MTARRAGAAAGTAVTALAASRGSSLTPLAGLALRYLARDRGWPW
jgi:hypothetical protein